MSLGPAWWSCLRSDDDWYSDYCYHYYDMIVACDYCIVQAHTRRRRADCSGDPDQKYLTTADRGVQLSLGPAWSWLRSDDWYSCCYYSDRVVAYCIVQVSLAACP